MSTLIPSLLLAALPVQAASEEAENGGPQADIDAAARLSGLDLTSDEIELMAPGFVESRNGYERLRARALDNGVFPAALFDPAAILGIAFARAEPRRSLAIPSPQVDRPTDLAELYFADIPTLAALIRARTVSCLELTELFLGRLREIDAQLECVITLTPERAYARARTLDAELARGEWRGLLHGIPWGAKDLLAVRGYPTTWGATPYKSQVIDQDATVVRRLDDAGAVLIAKLTLGALAWGDVWFGGTTRNPWNPAQGSSGSSAGSAAAVAAGGVPFALGTETLGSIVSPSERCGNSSLRPSFGRVSRDGAMALSWSMDKLGPLCRSATDAAIVFAAIHGTDARDPTTRSAPLDVPAQPSIDGWDIGIVESHFENRSQFEHVIGELESLGARIVPVELPEYPVGDMTFVLNVEGASAFDELTRSGTDDQLVRQEQRAWPNVFRQAQLVPAVEYLRAMRLRTPLTRDWEQLLRKVDVLCHPSFAGEVLAATNLTGHPTFVAPCGFRENGTPYGISFTARLFADDKLLTLVRAWQQSTDYHKRHPEL